MNRMDLALNNLQWLICYNTEPYHVYCSVIKCVFILRSINDFGCFRNIMAQFEQIKLRCTFICSYISILRSEKFSRFYCEFPTDYFIAYYFVATISLGLFHRR